MKITRKGKIKLLRADGSVVSEHNEYKEAIESADNQPDGIYKIKYPEEEVVIKHAVAPPVDPPPVDPPPVDPPPVDPPPAGANPFNALYPVSFKLPAMAADPIPAVTRPAKSTGLADAFIDPTYKTRVYRASDAAAQGSKEQLRHDYSRRQAFNADNSRYLEIDGNGNVYLFDAATFAKVKVLPGIAGGDSEPLWHPTDPHLLRHTSMTGGSKWYELNVETGERTVLFDFAGKTPWADAARFWTKAEGSFSADGRYICLMAMAQDYGMRGVVCFDSVDKKIVGSLSTTSQPDHVSMSASGRWCVVSGAQTVAYSRDFKTSKVLYQRSQHSDLGLNPAGNDVIVYAEFAPGADEGWIVGVNLDTGERTRITQIYDTENHGSTTVHISCQCFGRPGWCVVSTYDDFSNYGTYPSTVLRPLYRKVSLHSMDGARHYSVAHIHGDSSVGNAYFHEPQATISRDGSRIMFASAFGSPGQPEDYMVGLPDSVFTV